jgi:hypothetical protein
VGIFIRFVSFRENTFVSSDRALSLFVDILTKQFSSHFRSFARRDIGPERESDDVLSTEREERHLRVADAGGIAFAFTFDDLGDLLPFAVDLLLLIFRSDATSRLSSIVHLHTVLKCGFGHRFFLAHVVGIFLSRVEVPSTDGTFLRAHVHLVEIRFLVRIDVHIFFGHRSRQIDLRDEGHEQVCHSPRITFGIGIIAELQLKTILSTFTRIGCRSAFVVLRMDEVLSFSQNSSYLFDIVFVVNTTNETLHAICTRLVILFGFISARLTIVLTAE